MRIFKVIVMEYFEVHSSLLAKLLFWTLHRDAVGTGPLARGHLI